ncbi:MAG: S8 family serine peptidase [Kiritimatiellia bacterium]
MNAPPFSMKAICRVAGCAIFSALCMAVQAEEKPIRLRSRTIDTSAAVAQRGGSPEAYVDAVSVAAARTAETDGRSAYLVQFSGRVGASDRERLARIGAEAVSYVPDNALMVLMRPEKLPALSGLDGVRWIGAHEAGDKIAPDLTAIRSSKKTSTRIEVVISVLRPGYLFSVTKAVDRLGGAVVAQGKGSRWGSVRALIPEASLEELGALAEVEWIERFVQPELLNNVAVDAERMNVRSVWTNRGLKGAGQIIAVGDSGLDTGSAGTIHPDFSNRIHAAFGLVATNDWSDHSGHGTHVAGSVLGSGAAYSNGLFSGVAPEAGLVMQAIGAIEGGGYVYPPDPLNLLFDQARANGARIHTDSWGSDVSGQYTSNSRELDEFMWDCDDMLVLFSAGNSGRDANPTNGVIDGVSIGAPGTAKNCLTVGAAESARPAGSGGYSSYAWGIGGWASYYPSNPVNGDLISTPWDGTNRGMAAFSSRGPCADGRIKPDIVAPGTDIISCRSRGTLAGTLWGTGSGVLNNSASNHYTFSGGTSMSTPLTAGAAGVARQYLAGMQGMTNPSAAMLKALLVNGARSLTPGQYGTNEYREIPAAPRPNNVEGWGHVDLDNTLFPQGGRTNLFWDRQMVSTGRTNRYPLVITGAGALNITLAWSDYPASLAAAQQLVNDLDLRLVTPSSSIVYPHGASGPDRTNNLLGIDVASAETGTNWIEVSGYNVPEGPQKFALMAKAEGWVPSLLQIYSVWHDPETVFNAQTVSVFAAVDPGPVGLAAVVAVYRINSNDWNYASLALDSDGGQTHTYRGNLPPFASRDFVEYYVYAMSYDLTVIYSETNSFAVGSSTVYVSPSGSSLWPYDDWIRSFTNLQEAMDHVRDGQTIIVSNGTYKGYTFAVDQAVTVTSVNGPADTIVDGESTRRCASIVANAVVSGFTFQNGYTSGDGGGVEMSDGLLSNCVIKASAAVNNGGGLHLAGGTVARSLICSNDAGLYGGGILQEGGYLLQSVVSGNESASDAGGIEFWGGYAVNCTFASNHAGGYGGGFDVGGYGLILNNIIHGNTAQEEGENWYKWVDQDIYYCCTSPDPGDEGCFDADPLFADADAGDYHLKSEAGRFVETGMWTNDAVTSPCIDMGYPGADCYAEPAPNGDRVNIGAYGGTEEASKGYDNSRRLIILSAVGGVHPAAGIFTAAPAEIVSCTVTSPVITGISTQYTSAGWALAGLQNTNGAVSGAEDEVVLSLTTNAVLKWYWQTNVLLSVFTNGPGTVSSTNGWHAYASTTWLNAYPDQYCGLTSWTGSVVSTSNPLTLSMTSARKMWANFDPLRTAQNVPYLWFADYGWTSDFEVVAVSDADGDGALSWQEYVAGTDPTNASSAFILSAAGGGTDPAAIAWRAVALRTYTGYWSTNFLEGFSNVLFSFYTNVTLDVSMEDALNTNQLPVYYRLKVEFEE